MMSFIVSIKDIGSVPNDMQGHLIKMFNTKHVRWIPYALAIGIIINVMLPMIS